MLEFIIGILTRPNILNWFIVCHFDIIITQQFGLLWFFQTPEILMSNQQKTTKITMEGPLKLTGSLFHHTYYFKFDPPILQKYKNTTQQYPLETYDISAVNTKVLDTSRLYGFQNSFGIFIASKQPLILIAKDEKEQQAWIKELCKYCVHIIVKNSYLLL